MSSARDSRELLGAAQQRSHSQASCGGGGLCGQRGGFVPVTSAAPAGEGPGEVEPGDGRERLRAHALVDLDGPADVPHRVIGPAQCRCGNAERVVRGTRRGDDAGPAAAEQFGVGRERTICPVQHHSIVEGLRELDQPGSCLHE